MVKLTVVLPALHSHSALLRRSVMSLRDSPDTDAELIMLQDVAAMPDSRGPGIYAPAARVLIEEGISIRQAIDRGVREATGDFVGVPFPGSIYLANALTAASDRLDRDAGIDVLHGSCRHTNADWSRRWRTGAVDWNVEDTLRSASCAILPAATFFRRATFLELGGCHFDQVWDLDLWIRYARTGARFEAEPRCLAEQYERFAGLAESAGFAAEVVAVVADATGRESPWRAHRRLALAAAHSRALSLDHNLSPVTALRHFAGAVTADPGGLGRYTLQARRSLQCRHGEVRFSARWGSTMWASLEFLIWGTLGVNALKSLSSGDKASSGRQH